MERFEKKQVFKNGEPNVRYRLEERIDEEHKVQLVATPIPAELLGGPTPEDLAKVQELRLREALQADPTLGGKIVEPVWTGEFDNSSDEGSNIKL